MKKKLNLNTLKIDSFITTLQEAQKQTIHGMMDDFDQDASAGKVCRYKILLGKLKELNPQQLAKYREMAWKRAASYAPFKCIDKIPRLMALSIPPYHCPK